nr:hypothetical protein [Tanacetum cinerariifolium]
AIHDECKEVYLNAHQIIKESVTSNSGSSDWTNFPEYFNLDLSPLDELDCEVLALGTFGGSISLLVFLFFNPWSDPTEGSSSLSFSFRLLFNEYTLP